VQDVGVHLDSLAWRCNAMGRQLDKGGCVQAFGHCCEALRDLNQLHMRKLQRQDMKHTAQASQFAQLRNACQHEP
jgi:hypothetical protein